MVSQVQQEYRHGVQLECLELIPEPQDLKDLPEQVIMEVSVHRVFIRVKKAQSDSKVQVQLVKPE